MQTGEPYIVFIDAIRRAVPEGYKLHNLTVHGSNLCVEITLHTSVDRTAVCCLSSPNLETYDEWEHDDLFLHDCTEYLDNVIEYFIRNAPEEMWRAVASAKEERSIGLGAMGFHTFLQRKGIPFDNVMAKSWNNRIFYHMQEETLEASERLAAERGEPLICEGTGVRNAHRLAIAPNASSSLILGGVSPGIEPLRANAFTQKTLSGSFTVKNPVLEELLEEKGENTPETWSSIVTHKGSVAHLDCLNDWEKEVFATAMEIPQIWVIEHAADRTPYICQSQSLNLFLPPDIDRKAVHDLHFIAWKKGIKTLYYMRSEAIKRAEVVSTKIERKNLYHFQEETCLSCEG
jgi:ribonucleoside-diphosphate reductase alpha chain